MGSVPIFQDLGPFSRFPFALLRLLPQLVADFLTASAIAQIAVGVSHE
jgi:hypothetical protein